MQEGKQPLRARLQLLARLTLNAGEDAANQPARLAQLDDGNDRAILVQGNQGPAQIVRLGHRGTPSIDVSDEIAILAARPIASHRWRGQSRANPSLTSKFPASRENAGNFVDSGVKGASKAAKRAAKSVFYELIPDASEQGIFGARAGNLIGRSGNFSPRSGTPTKVT